VKYLDYNILGSTANYHRMLATVSSDSSSISSPPTSPDNISGTTYTPDYYNKKSIKSDQRNMQSIKDLSKDVDSDHYKAEKKGKEKDIKFYQKILSSTGLDRLSKSASSTGVPKTSVYKEKLKHGTDEMTLSPVSIKTL